MNADKLIHLTGAGEALIQFFKIKIILGRKVPTAPFTKKGVTLIPLSPIFPNTNAFPYYTISHMHYTFPFTQSPDTPCSIRGTFPLQKSRFN